MSTREIESEWGPAIEVGRIWPHEIGLPVYAEILRSWARVPRIFAMTIDGATVIYQLKPTPSPSESKPS
jgi:hypothetical protein